MGKKAFKEDEPPGCGAWMVSFSDCMTNLLTFFVLLCSFSSFDEESLERMSGVFDSMSVYSVFPGQHNRNEAVVEPLERPVDVTPNGSESPTINEPSVTERPKAVGWNASQDAYSDQRVLVIPASDVFSGRGSQLSDGGKRFLDLLAELLARLPCHVVIDQTVPPGEDPASAASVDRAYAAMAYLQRPALSGSAFSIGAGQVSTSARNSEKPMLRITLLKRSFYQ